MATLLEIVPDLVLCSLYIFLLLRIVTASDSYFKTDFYIFFTATGVYGVIAVLSYQLLLIFQFNEKYWTYHFYKVLYAGNSLGASGAMYGKLVISMHRYYVMQRRNFTEKGLSRSTILRVLAAQLAISLIETASIWPASFVYMEWNGKKIIIQRGHAVVDYSLFIVINSIFTFLTSREMYRMRALLKDSSPTSRAMILQQRTMFIIVTVCSLSHLFKVAHQSVILISTLLELDDLYYAIFPFYPLVNGFATYATPFCLVLFSPRLRERLVFSRGHLPLLVSPTVTQSR